MATLPQSSLFSWEIVDASPEIERIGGVLASIPDERLMRTLEARRGDRRDVYPIRAVWNSFLAGILCGHPGQASLIRELKRNGELREVCGFPPEKGEAAVPPDYVYSRLFVRLIDHLDRVDAIFDALVERVAAQLPDFGRQLAMDSKALPTHARTDSEADQGTKTYADWSEDGTPRERLVSWFGYKLHLLVDSTYELPVAAKVTSASEADSPHLMPMIEEVRERHPEVHARAEDLTCDRAYDDGEDKAALYDDYDILPVIDSRVIDRGRAGPWRPLNDNRHDTIYFNDLGEVVCKADPFAPGDRKYAALQFAGFERDRGTLKFRCPAAAFGIECKNRNACRCPSAVRDGQWGRTVRIPLSRDRRVFMPVHRQSRDFEARYKRRGAVERVNSRIDCVYGFERRSIRGLNKMKLRMGLSLIVMLATANWWVERGRLDNMRRLLTPAA